MNALGTKSYQCAYAKLLFAFPVLVTTRLKVCVRFKTSSISLSMSTHSPLFYTICPRRLNRVSRHLKTIIKEKIVYHKALVLPIWSAIFSCKVRFWILLWDVCLVPCVCIFRVLLICEHWNFKDKILLRRANVIAKKFNVKVTA